MIQAEEEKPRKTRKEKCGGRVRVGQVWVRVRVRAVVVAEEDEPVGGARWEHVSPQSCSIPTPTPGTTSSPHRSSSSLFRSYEKARILRKGAQRPQRRICLSLLRLCAKAHPSARRRVAPTAQKTAQDYFKYPCCRRSFRVPGSLAVIRMPADQICFFCAALFLV
jgi:hypothetical protein